MVSNGFVNAILGFVGGPAGIFLISLVSNSIPFVAIPYLGVVMGYSFVYVGLLPRVMLVLVSAAGATIGKVAVYYMGSAFRAKLGKVSRRNIELFKKLARRSLFIAIVVFASTPLPDDVLYIPLGLMKYPLLPYVLAVFLGKTILTGVVVTYASWLSFMAVTQVYTVPVLVAVTVLLTYIILKVDWYEVINKLYSEGPIPAWNAFVAEVRKAFRRGQRNGRESRSYGEPHGP